MKLRRFTQVCINIIYHFLSLYLHNDIKINLRRALGNNFTLFYHYAQARMKLPKRPQNALVGAANALVAETSQHSVSPDEEDDDENSKKASIDMTTLNGGNICYSKR